MLLGECALVPDPSPISQSGITLTLFSMKCFKPLGYRSSLCDQSVAAGAGMSEEPEAAGLNQIAPSQMDIDGIREDGTRVPLFRNGDWAN